MQNILITAGGTTEKIDDVRGITNFSSGRLGVLIAKTLRNSNSKFNIFLIKNAKTDVSELIKNPIYNSDNEITIINTTDTKSVLEAIEKTMNEYEIHYFIHSMAISDYTVDKVVNLEDIVSQLDTLKDSDGKLDINEITQLLYNSPVIDNSKKVSSNIEHPILYLKKTPKLISKIKENWSNTKLFAFKLLSNVSQEELETVAISSMNRVNSDYVIANDLKNIDSVKHNAVIISKDLSKTYLNSKIEIAEAILDIIEKDKN